MNKKPQDQQEIPEKLLVCIYVASNYDPIEFTADADELDSIVEQIGDWMRNYGARDYHVLAWKGTVIDLSKIVAINWRIIKEY